MGEQRSSAVRQLLSRLAKWLKRRCSVVSVGRTEYDAITDDEFILRRIHKNNYFPSKPIPVVRTAFEPKAEDHDGGSFNREEFVSAEELAYKGRKPGEYYIARFSIATLRSEEWLLTIEPLPENDSEEPRGHCVIRELSIERHEADEERSVRLQRRLAELASTNIVYIPMSRR